MRSLAILILTVACAFGASPVIPDYPLKLASGKHYLVDQNNQPFLIQGDSPWFLTEVLSQSDVEYYISNRWVQGYNSIILDWVAVQGDTGQAFNGDLYGQLPFTGTIAGPYTNLLAWNIRYFTNVDWVVNKAGQYGICVFAYPLYDGFNGATWYHEMAGNPTSSLTAYGAFIGSRYKDVKNLVWLGAGDYSEPGSPTLWSYVASGIASEDTNHLISAQAARPTAASYYSWITVNCSYGSLYSYVESLANYNESPTLASFAREPYYENRNVSGHVMDALNCRQFSWWSLLYGDAGWFYGDENQWPFTTGWQTEMQDAGATTQTNIWKLALTRPWWNLVPDSGHTTVTSGYGTSGTTNYITAARHSTGATAIVYIPVGTMTPTVDMTQISGAYAHTWWYNPRTGITSYNGRFATSGTKTFTPPDGNDWTLVLDDAGAGLGTPGLPNPPLFSGTFQWSAQ